VPLVRALRGDAEAVKRWQETERAPFADRVQIAFDAALALEATGRHEEAEAAYRFASDPDMLTCRTLDVLAARVKLAAMLRSQKRDGEADELDKAIVRLWASAEPGVLAAIRRLK
jgi:uncharacterized protein YerC